MYGDEVRKRIQKELAALPKFVINCVWCKKYCATLTQPVELIHYDCWREYQYVEKRKKQRLLAAVLEETRQKLQ